MKPPRAGFLVCVLAGSACGAPAPELGLQIRETGDRRLFAAIVDLRLSAERDDRVLAQEDHDPTATFVQISGVSYGPRTVFSLEGLTATGDVVARGRTCPLDFTAPANGGPRTAVISFAPTNSFAPTLGPPLVPRDDAHAWALDDGTIMITGGTAGGTAVSSSERFSVSTSMFSDDPLAALNTPRRRAEVTPIAGIGVLLSGGLSTDGTPLATAELYEPGSNSFRVIENAAIGPRVGHRGVTLASDRILFTGGAANGSVVLDSTAVVELRSDGGATASVGPPLVRARREHAAAMVSGVPVMIGGYGNDGSPLGSIEALIPSATSTRGEFREIATLRTARAEATANVLPDGTILVTGGARDLVGTPAVDAEVYNPITSLTTPYSLAVPRRGHTATALPDGRILIIGGIGASGAPLASVELFIPGVGFVSERSLGTPRAGHRAVPLCDDTVLVVGGGAGAEVYTLPP